MTVAHKNLTGTDLHIIKGADTATVGKVPIANGSGDAPFGLLTHTSLQTTGNPFGAQLFHCEERQTSGTNSGSTASNGAWNTSPLNTAATAEITSGSLVGNRMSLPAGTYYIEAFCPAYVTGSASAQARIANNATGTTLLAGTNLHANSGTVTILCRVAGRLTLASTTEIILQVFSNNFVSAPLATSATTEVYGSIMVWKVA